jgi:hypothetical protein
MSMARHAETWCVSPNGENMNHSVTSREYKLMLNTERFKNRDEGSLVFLNLIDFLIGKEGGAIIEKQNVEEKRQTSYLDTFDLALHRHGFALRLREEAKANDGFQINLKYRASDRYISAAQDLSSPQADKIKFEEDILPPFVSKFSHSCSVKAETKPDLGRMHKVAELFPGLEELDIDGDTVVKTVNDFTALEVVRKLCKFQFGGTPVIKASLSFWYLTKNENDWPLVGEFSFDYDEPDRETDETRLETYPSRVVEGASRFFSALQGQAGWMNFNATTKTAFALEGL